MTRRERMERRLEKRLEWAESREKKAAALLKQNEPLQGDVSFNTQPGHIPERARAIAREDRAFDHVRMADHHLARADGIESQLEKSIFSDDEDAAERLAERIAELEEERSRMKTINAEIRKGEGWQARLQAKGLELTARETQILSDVARFQPYYADKKTGIAVFPPYALSNLSGNISRLKKRLSQIER